MTVGVPRSVLGGHYIGAGLWRETVQARILLQ